MEPQKNFSRPADESLEAYKRWVRDLAKSLGVKKEDVTDEEYERGWKEFWANKK